MNSKQTMVTFSPEWKTFVADAIGKAPSDRTPEEREAIALAKADDSEVPRNDHFGIRCERDGTGQDAPAVAWYQQNGKIQQFAAYAEAQRVAASLSSNSPRSLRYQARAFVLGLDDAAKLSDSALSAAARLWAREHIGLAEAVCKAQAFAAVEAERVDKYINPIFAEFEFLTPEGKKITDRDDLYLSEDQAKVHEFWARCDLAHRANGFTGQLGVWPNRQADHLRNQGENALVKSFCDFIGARSQPWGKRFAQMVKLLIASCLAVKSEAK
jgi:hypothetical protein